MPDNFYQINKDKANNLFLQMNTSSVSYDINDLNTSIRNCKNKPKVTGISECRIKTGRPSLLNINMNNYSHILPLSHLKEGYCYILIKT